MRIRAFLKELERLGVSEITEVLFIREDNRVEVFTNYLPFNTCTTTRDFNRFLEVVKRSGVFCVVRDCYSYPGVEEFIKLIEEADLPDIKITGTWTV